jgi:hypothetical protein
MSSLILDANSPIQPAFDPYWDKPMSRREAQVLFRKIGNNQTELHMGLDTVNIVANFLCDKLNVTRGELDAYADKKKAEAQAWAEAQNKTQETNNDLGRTESVQP